MKSCYFPRIQYMWVIGEDVYVSEARCVIICIVVGILLQSSCTVLLVRLKQA